MIVPMNPMRLPLRMLMQSLGRKASYASIAVPKMSSLKRLLYQNWNSAT